MNMRDEREGRREGVVRGVCGWCGVVVWGGEACVYGFSYASVTRAQSFEALQTRACGFEGSGAVT